MRHRGATFRMKNYARDWSVFIASGWMIPTLPAEVRADLTDEIADLETGRFQCDPGRGARIRAYLRARV